MYCHSDDYSDITLVINMDEEDESGEDEQFQSN